jgi:hypothetical protein
VSLFDYYYYWKCTLSAWILNLKQKNTEKYKMSWTNSTKNNIKKRNFRITSCATWYVFTVEQFNDQFGLLAVREASDWKKKKQHHHTKKNSITTLLPLARSKLSEKETLCVGAYIDFVEWQQIILKQKNSLDMRVSRNGFLMNLLNDRC